jgi:hypothetical protein
MGFGTLQTGWYILELFRQGGIFVFFNSMAYMLYIVDALERDLRPFAVLKLFAFPINSTCTGTSIKSVEVMPVLCDLTPSQ